MTPRPVLDLLPYDEIIWVNVQLRAGSRVGSRLFTFGLMHDSRDSDVMWHLALLRCRGTAYLRLGPCNYEVPLVHVYLRKDPLWPPPSWSPE